MGVVVRFSGRFSRAFANQSLLRGSLGQRQRVERKPTVCECNKDISEAEFDLFPGVSNLVAQPSGSAGALRERIPLSNGKTGEEGLEVGGVHASSLPQGNLKSRPLGKLPSGSFRTMDVYAIRRQRLLELLQTIKQVDLAAASKISATYISRLASDPSSTGHKRMGEEMARKIEQAARKPAGWLSQPMAAKHALPAHDAHFDEDIDIIMSVPSLAEKFLALRQDAAAIRATMKKRTGTS